MTTVSLDPNSIARIMTLRYDPLQRPVRKPLAPADFKPCKVEGIEEQIAEKARIGLERFHDHQKFRNVCLSLSGGVDSRITLAFLRRFLPEVKVLCIGVGFGDPDDEIPYAKEIARKQDAEFSSIVIDDILTNLPGLISITKQPRWNVYQYYAFEQGKRVSDVFFTGDGGDEIFGGYTFRYQKFLSMLPKNSLWKTRSKCYISCHDRDWVPEQRKIFGSAVHFSWNEIYESMRKSFDNNLQPLDQVFLADFNGKLLFDWLPTNIAFSNELKLRIESILLSPIIIRLATHIPWKLKYDPVTNMGKLPLRKLLSSFEKSQVNVPKRGFSMNLPSMWRSYGYEKVRDYLNDDSDVVKYRIISSAWLERSMKRLEPNEVELDARYINKMLSILALEIWYRLFVSKSMKKTDRI